MSKRSATTGHRRSRPKPQLAAALIVRDEEAHISTCLTALRGVVDEIHVHDTGSTDATPHLATLLGAQVTRGGWTNDFAAARNAALVGWSAEWVLSVDADEIVVADHAALRELLATTSADVLNIAIDNVAQEEGLRHTASRLFRPDAAGWYGRVHEQLIGRHEVARRVDVPREILRIEHVGYATAEARRAKSQRNTDLARAEVAALAAQGDGVHPDLVARALLDLGRSLYGAEETQEAIDTFEVLRELFPDGKPWIEATDYLARLVLNNGMEDVALTLVMQLRSAGADPGYCNWLEARCLAQLGHLGPARDLLADLDEVIDLNGRRRDPVALVKFKRDIDDLLATAAV